MKQVYLLASLLFAFLAMPVSKAQVAKWQSPTAPVVSAARVPGFATQSRAAESNVLAQYPELQEIASNPLQQPLTVGGPSVHTPLFRGAARADVTFTVSAFQEDDYTPFTQGYALIYGPTAAIQLLNSDGSATFSGPAGTYYIFVFDNFQHPVLVTVQNIVRTGQSVDLSYAGYHETTMHFKNASVPGVETTGFYVNNDQWASFINSLVRTESGEPIVFTVVGINNSDEASFPIWLPTGTDTYTMICDGQDSESSYPLDGYIHQTVNITEPTTLTYDFSAYKPLRAYVNNTMKTDETNYYPRMNFCAVGNDTIINSYPYPVILLPNGDYQAFFFYDYNENGNIVPDDSLSFTKTDDLSRIDFNYDLTNDFSVLTLSPSAELSNYTGSIAVNGALLNFSGEFAIYVKKGTGSYYIPYFQDGNGRTFYTSSEIIPFDASGETSSVEFAPYTTPWLAMTMTHNAFDFFTEEDMYNAYYYLFSGNEFLGRYYTDEELNYSCALPYGDYQIRTYLDDKWYIAEFSIDESSPATRGLVFTEDLTGVSTQQMSTLSAQPTAEGLLVLAPAAGKVSVAIYDAAGKQLVATTAQPGSTVAAGNLPAGVYVAVLTQGNQKATVKYLVK